MYTFVTGFKDIFISYRFCLHPLHLIGCFFSYVFALFTFVFFRARDLLIFLNTGLVYIRSYVFALYIFVTHFERFI